MSADRFRRAVALKQLHNETFVERERIRKIMNGGREGVAALMGGTAGKWDSLPTANFMLSQVKRQGQRLGVMPTTRVDPPQHLDKDIHRRRADKIERIVTSWDDECGLEMMLPQIGQWLPGYGFAVLIVKEQVGRDGYVYPHLELRDSFDCYPGAWGPAQQPREMTIIRKASLHDLAQQYPDMAAKLLPQGRVGSRRFGGAVDLAAYSSRYDAGWENQTGGDVELHEYYDEEGCWTLVPERELVLNFVPNLLDGRPQFVVGKRFSFDRLQGQFEHIVGIMASRAKLNVMAQMLMEDSIFSPINVYGQLDGEYRVGRNEVNYLQQGDKVERLAHRMDHQAFQQVDRLERELRITAGNPVQADGESPNAFVTGRGLAELGSGVESEEREYRLIIKRMLQEADSMRLELAERSHGNRQIPLSVFHNGEAHSEKYNPATDIKGMWKTRRVYGTMAGWDEPSKIVTGLQLLQANIISDITMMENIEGIQSVPKELERIQRTRAQGGLLQGLAAKAAEGDQRAIMTLLEMGDDGSSYMQAVKKYWTPEEPQMSPEEAAMAQMAEMGMPGMPGGAAPPMGQMGPPQDVATVLSQLGQDGGVEGGIQTVGRLPARAGSVAA